MSSPTARTAALAAVLAVGCAAVLVAAPPGEPVLPAPWALSPAAVTAGLAVVFCVAELGVVHLEVRRHSFTTTLSAVTVAFGLLMVDATHLVAACVLGSVAAFAIQRLPLLKAAYNVSAYAAEAALDAALVAAVLLPADGLTLRTVVGTVVTVSVVGQLFTALIVRVIGWHQGRVPRREALQIHVSGLLWAALAATVALGVAGLVDDGVGGLVVLGACLGAAIAVYRGYQVLHHRHRALQQVHDFVALTAAPDNVRDGVTALAGSMLGEIRSLMHATRAELLLVTESGALQLAVDDSGDAAAETGAWAGTDPLVTRVRRHHSTLVVGSRRADVEERAWLAARGAGEAVVVPLPRSSGDGAVMVFDRLGDTGSFGRQDRSLLQTLTAHLAIAVQSNGLLDQMRHDATHDRLTGLPNRVLLEQRIAEATGPGGPGGTVAFLDLDRFKEVNDTLGHHIGDLLLCSVAARIQDALRPDATVARLGADEFGFFLPGVRYDPDAVSIAARVAEAIAEPMELQEATLTSQSSVGIAQSSRDADVSDLLRHADTAMYVAKESGAGVTVYSEELDRGRAERRALLADLRLALDRGELFLVYQPKVDLRTNRVDSVEALVRWQHPRLGLLSPVVFIALAESNGLIGRLTEWVLGEALRQSAHWHDDGLDLAVAVNVAAQVIAGDGLPDLVSSALRETDVPASRLILEITESSVIDDPDHAVAVLERIAALGVTLSLDDFGTGYSSLAYLQRLPVSEVKIDRSFVRGLRGNDRRSQVLVRSIIGLATDLGHKVVAEGAETEETVEVLRGLGAHLVQGYFYARPGSPEVVAAFARGRSRPPGPRLRIAHPH